jgi:hypothetical protein
MKKLSSTKEIEAIGKPKFKCEFCAGEYVRESTLMTHMCESKRRWMNKDLQGNRIAYQSFVQFYKKNSSSKKQKTYEEFIKSPYYTAFVKFGNHCVEISALNVSRYADWLVKSQIRIDTWCTDTNYTNYLLEYIRTEDPLDAIHRSIETTMALAEVEKIQSRDYLRYGNVNRICLEITRGRISPWMLFQSESGVKFVESLEQGHVKMVFDYIDPEKWALKFHREPENVKQVKELLNAGGY